MATNDNRYAPPGLIETKIFFDNEQIYYGKVINPETNTYFSSPEFTTVAEARSWTEQKLSHYYPGAKHIIK